jgi:hypothetical protein
MKILKTTIVVTSISAPSTILEKISKTAETQNIDFILIGDKKSPQNFALNGCDYFDLTDQKGLPFKFSKRCPEGHYARKNIGYLEAIRRCSSIIWETDDDNIPAEGFKVSNTEGINGGVVSKAGWCNVYSFFTNQKIWPRGLPLNEISQASPALSENSTCSSPIQQGLADNNPDVDAIYRLVGVLPVEFNKRTKPIILEHGVWCPFNSQNTTWFKRAFPLLYLPSFCSFRMTDIWRGFVAQRILWTIEGRLSFHNANVRQERNEHDLLDDFRDEISGYLGNGNIKTLLENLPLRQGEKHILENLRSCYQALVNDEYIDADEMSLLDSWISDIEAFH